MARFPVETSGEKIFPRTKKKYFNIFPTGVRCEEPKKHHKKKMSSLKLEQLKCKFSVRFSFISNLSDSVMQIPPTQLRNPPLILE